MGRKKGTTLGRKKRSTATREGDGGKEERGSLLLNENLDCACRNAIFRRIHLVETFLPREKIQSNREGAVRRRWRRSRDVGGSGVQTRKRWLRSKIDREETESLPVTKIKFAKQDFLRFVNQKLARFCSAGY